MRASKTWKAAKARTTLQVVSFVAVVSFVCVLPPVLAFPASSQQRIDSLVAAVRPLLPFPDAGRDGELPADNSPKSKWFVVWPASPDDTRIVVKANPLHPDTQKAGAEAMNGINAAVAAAERRAQAAYDKALEQLRRTGKGSDLESITLDDEGVAGERIDAELEVIIEIQPAASYQIASREAPSVTPGTRGAAWIVTLPAHTYQAKSGPDLREHFRAAEARAYLGTMQKPYVARKGDAPLFSVTVTPGSDAFAVVIRGNEGLVKQLTASVDWARVAAP